MVSLSELRSLNVGDKFSFVEGGELCEVETVGLLDYDGDWPASLVLYRYGSELFGHVSDHSSVWVLVG